MKQPAPRSDSSAAFTLIELLTVIAIIGILAAILIPVVGEVREQAKVAQCKVHLRDIGTAVHLYATDHDDMIPPHIPAGGSAPSSEWGSRVDIHGVLGFLLAPEKGGVLIPGAEHWSGAYLDDAAPLMCPATREELYSSSAAPPVHPSRECEFDESDWPCRLHVDLSRAAAQAGECEAR